MTKIKEKIIEKGTGFVAKQKSKKQLQKVLPKPIANQVGKKIGKGVESLTSMAMDIYKRLKK